MLKIYKLVPVEGKEPKRVFVKDFEEKPAPHVTIGGHLLALENETGFEHVAVG
jgi:hypothetical protein